MLRVVIAARSGAHCISEIRHGKKKAAKSWLGRFSVPRWTIVSGWYAWIVWSVRNSVVFVCKGLFDFMVERKHIPHLLFVFFCLICTQIALAGSDEYLPDAELNSLVSGSSSLAEFRGKPLVINVWASWCGPCRSEMGSLERLSKQFDRNRINLIGVSTDDDRNQAIAYLKREKISFRNYIDRNLVLEKILKADRLPLTILIDADGRVIKRIYGARSWDSPEAINLITQAFRLANK